MGAVLYELRLGARRLLRDPWRSGISVVAFTLGIGLTASMFSIAYTILFRGTPFDQGDQLVAVERRHPETGARLRWMPYLDYLDVAASQNGLSGIGAWTRAGLDLVDEESHAVRLAGARISPSFLDMLRIAPQLGRGFTSDETGPDARVALLSDRLWRTRYGADPQTVGRAIRLNGERFTIVGIMAPGFHFPTEEDVWLPFSHDPATLGRDDASVQVMARLARDAEPAAATSELDGILARLEREYGDGGRPASAALVPYVRSNMGGDDVSMLWAMMIGSLLVLAIACVNVTNLLTAVAADRTGEVALRTVLGASRRRIIAQLLLDAVLLSLVGGVLGVLLASGVVRWFGRALSGQVPLWLSFEIDGPILGFAFAVSFGAALLAGLTPALRSAGLSVREVLQDESRGASSRGLGRLSHAMVVATMALAYPLLVAAGLLIASLGAWNGELPFDRERVLVAQLSLPPRSHPNAETRARLVDELVEWAEGQPGIVAATWGDVVPALGVGTGRIELEGEQYLRDEDYPRARLAAVRPGFFETMGVRDVRGRRFDPRDRAGPPVAIVNEPFAARHFPDSDPIGRRVRVVGPDEPYRTIVGVVPDLRMNGTDQSVPEGLYLPTPPVDPLFGYLLVRTAGDPAPVAPVVRAGIAEVEPDQPIQVLETLEGRIERAFWVINVVGPIFTAFGLAALFLASVGLFGVVAHSVSRRTREIGVRMALGATGGSVLATIARTGLLQATLGVALGSGLALVGSRLLAGALYGVRPGDPAIMAVVGGVLVGSAFLATLLPALRAMRLSPVEALRDR